MFRKVALVVGGVALAVGLFASGSPVRAQGGAQVGTLTCNVASGWGFVFGSSRALRCTFASASGRTEYYTGTIRRFGVDIGFTRAGVLIWGVLAPTSNLSPGALAGEFAGATGSATGGVGAGANVLVGGSSRTISLQPVSFEGSTGLNVAAGIGAISLRYEPRAGRR